MRNIKRGDVYFVKLDHVCPHTQFGRRPCLVVQNNLGNTFSSTLIVIPLTTKLKKMNLPVHVFTGTHEIALCECVLTISKYRLCNYIKTLDDDTMKLIDNALSISLGLKEEVNLLKK